jgi:ubiquinone/menaquinone biosynthesis C-methylase UbiE
MFMADHIGKVEEQFGSVAKNYLSSTVHNQGTDLAAVAERISSKPGSNVLDLGCGAGHLSFSASTAAATVTAYDVSSDMLRVVTEEAQRRRIGNLITRKGRAESLPFADASFDWVCTRFSAHHWSDVPQALQEIRRVLKQDGSIILIDICAPSNPLLDTHLQAIEILRDGSHVRNYSAEQWQAMFAKAGFRLQTQTSWKLPLHFETWVTRMRTPEVYVRAISALLQHAPREVREYFQIEADGSFVPDTYMLEAN